MKCDPYLVCEWLVLVAHNELTCFHEDVLGSQVQVSVVLEAQTTIDLNKTEDWALRNVKDHVPLRLDLDVVPRLWKSSVWPIGSVAPVDEVLADGNSSNSVGYAGTNAPVSVDRDSPSFSWHKSLAIDDQVELLEVTTR